MDKYGSSIDISLRLCHLKLRGFRTSMFGAFQIEVTNMPHPQRHLPQISHPTPSGYHECIIYTMFPTAAPRDQGKVCGRGQGRLPGLRGATSSVDGRELLTKIESQDLDDLDEMIGHD